MLPGFGLGAGFEGWVWKWSGAWAAGEDATAFFEDVEPFAVVFVGGHFELQPEITDAGRWDSNPLGSLIDLSIPFANLR